MITIIGLGPGRAGLMTIEVWQMMLDAKDRGDKLYLRTAVHPTVAELVKEGIAYQSYDNLYDIAADFTQLYESIAGDVVSKGRLSDIIYVVPGSPLVAEKTVELILNKAELEGVTVNIYPAMSFLEPLFTALRIDPIVGLTILDATDEIIFTPPDTNLVITQVYSVEVASDLKLALMEYFDDEKLIYYVHNLGLDDESIREIRLFELDWQRDIDHLTTIYIPRNELKTQDT